MQDYEVLDLADYCNVEISANADLEHVGITPEIVTSTSFRGLPFKFGGDTRLILADQVLTIPISKKAFRFIVAHRLVQFPESAPTGSEVAEYIFHRSNGKVVEPIRELFEIMYLREPSNSVISENPVLLPRDSGPWDEMAYRQMEARKQYQAPSMANEEQRLITKPSFCFWVWENPDPNSVIEYLEIRPNPGFTTVVGAITLSHVDEHPFSRQGRRPLMITLKDNHEASKPFGVSVDVDRGDSTYVHPLPSETRHDYLDHTHKGWGQEQNSKSSPSYVEISAIPSATLKVINSDQELASIKWGDVEEKGFVATPKVEVSLRDPGKNWVHVTILDDDTGNPIPCRVHFRSPEGIPYQPYGHHNQVNSNLNSFHNDIGGDLRLGQITYAYIDGKCQGWLPRGEVLVEVARGFEYEPLRTVVNITPGQRELTLRLNRWCNMNSMGWYSGDSHVHFVGAQGAHLESQGEDLNIVNLLQSQWGSLFTNTEDFTGEPSISQDGNNIVYVGQENRQHYYGHLILWGLKQPVMPWCTGEYGEAEIGSTMEVTLSDWADQAREQGAYVVAPHFAGLNGETAALIATGRLQAIEMHRQTKDMHWEYYRTLNAGYRMPLLGGTDKMSSDVPVGMYRTYVRIPKDEEFTYENWCRNVSKGRTFNSGGPIIGLTIDGCEIGDVIKLSGPGTVEVHAWAECTIPLGTLQIIVNGKVVGSSDSSTGVRRLEIKDSLYLDKHSWIAARCGGPGYWAGDKTWNHYDGWRRGLFAHTSPVYIAVKGDWWMFDEGTARHMLSVFEGDMSHIRNVVGQHPTGSVSHHHGEEDHIAYLERPFQEAREAVIKRMQEFGINV